MARHRFPGRTAGPDRGSHWSNVRLPRHDPSRDRRFNRRRHLCVRLGRRWVRRPACWIHRFGGRCHRCARFDSESPKVRFDHGEIGCKTPEAVGYIEKTKARRERKPRLYSADVVAKRCRPMVGRPGIAHLDHSHDPLAVTGEWLQRFRHRGVVPILLASKGVGNHSGNM